MTTSGLTLRRYGRSSGATCLPSSSSSRTWQGSSLAERMASALRVDAVSVSTDDASGEADGPPASAWMTPSAGAGLSPVVPTRFSCSSRGTG